MGCWKESGFRGQQARRLDPPLQTRRAELADEIRDCGVRFETHPLHAKFAFLLADDKDFQVFQVGLAKLRFGRGNSDVMVPAHCFSLSVELAQILRCRSRV